MKIKLFVVIIFLSLTFSNQAQTKPRLQIDFKGNKIFSSETLLKTLNLCLVRYSGSNDAYDAGLFDYCLRKDVADFLMSKGYITAKVSASQTEESQKSVTVAVAIEEGARYRVGDIRIQGQKAFTAGQLLASLHAKKRDIADIPELREWIYERLTKLYADRGYIQSDFDLTTHYKSAAGNEKIVDLDVEVDEGKQFIIGRIEFQGNVKTSDLNFRSALLIKEGKMYSQRQLDESLEKLNKLGLFEPIDKNRDVELRPEEVSPVLIIRIKVKKKEPF